MKRSSKQVPQNLDSLLDELDDVATGGTVRRSRARAISGRTRRVYGSALKRMDGESMRHSIVAKARVDEGAASRPGKRAYEDVDSTEDFDDEYPTAEFVNEDDEPDNYHQHAKDNLHDDNAAELQVSSQGNNSNTDTIELVSSSDDIQIIQVAAPRKKLLVKTNRSNRMSAAARAALEKHHAPQPSEPKMAPKTTKFCNHSSRSGGYNLLIFLATCYFFRRRKWLC